MVSFKQKKNYKTFLPMDNIIELNFILSHELHKMKVLRENVKSSKRNIIELAKIYCFIMQNENYLLCNGIKPNDQA